MLTQVKLLSGTFSNVRRAFNARGLLAQESMPFVSPATPQHTSLTYDVYGRLTLVQRPTSESDYTAHNTAFAYDGFRSTRTDALDRTSTTYRSVVGIAQVIDAMGFDTEYEYDAFGNLLGTRDHNGAEIALTYNIRGMKMTSSDPDMGQWTYDYFPLGELSSQRDAKNQTTTFTYDELSRPLTRVMPEGAGSVTSTFTWGASSSARNVGQLEWMQIAGAGLTTYRETYGYDSLGRPSQTTYTEGAANHLVNYAYNASTGLLEEIKYPTSTSGFRFRVRYDYQNGQPLRVWNADNGDQFWLANTADARGNITRATLGEVTNGVTFQMQSSFDQVTGLLESRQSTFNSGAVAGTVIANLGFLYDKVGNVIQRQDNQRGLTENFYYDNLDRLDYSTIGATTTDYSYDARGNLTSKSGVGFVYSYTANVPGCTYYPHAQVHAVRQITGGSSTMNFCYDANGNMTNRNGSAITWFANNLPKSITKDANNSSTFQYTPTGQRWRHVYRTSASNYTHTYFGALVERVVGPTTTDWKHYVHVNGEAIGLYIRKSNGAKTRYFFTKDHLGSIATITHAENTDWKVDESFDAFGQRRRGSSWSGSPTATDLARMIDTTRRGFTLHEHLDSTDLIHMNGRVYDPLIGRFVSADPFISAPYFSQSLNRYSYTFNNPLSYTDPSGFKADGMTRYQWIDFFPIATRFGSVFDGFRPDLWSLRRDVPPRPFTEPPPTLAPPPPTGEPPPDDDEIPADPEPAPGPTTVMEPDNPSTEGGACPGGCHTNGIAIPEVTPEVRAATTRFYQNLIEDFTPGLGLYRAATGEYLFSGDEASRLGGALASVPYFGIVLRSGARLIPWSSRTVRAAAESLEIGATEVRVGSKSEAAELFLGRYQGAGYRNSTGMSPRESKDFFGGKAGTYHWDIGDAAFPHGASHLQIHTLEGQVIRIYFPD